MQEQEVGLIVFRMGVNEAVGGAAGDALTPSKGGKTNGCHCRISAVMEFWTTISEEL